MTATEITMPATDVVVAGGGLGAVRVAQELRSLGFGGTITILGDEPHAPYDRPPLSKEVLAGVGPNPPPLLTATEVEQLALDLRTDTRLVALDATRRTVTTSGGEVLSFGVLVIATGARTRPWAPAKGLRNVHALRSTEDAGQVQALLSGGARIAVVGAGFIGCEVAAAARQQGCVTTMIEMLPAPLAHVLGAAAAQEVAQRHLTAGVDLRCGTTVESLQIAGDRAVAVDLSDGTRVDVDGVVVGIGVTPNCDWLTGSGVELANGVLCDATGRTSCDGVYAVGDVASWADPTTGERRRVEHWTSATEQARIVAGRIVDADQYVVANREVPYFWSDQHGVKLQLVGEAGGVAIVLRSTSQRNSDRPVFLYADGDRLVGALTFGQPRTIMKLKSLVAAGARVDAACDLVLAGDDEYRRQEQP